MGQYCGFPMFFESNPFQGWYWLMDTDKEKQPREVKVSIRQSRSNKLSLVTHCRRCLYGSHSPVLRKKQHHLSRTKVDVSLPVVGCITLHWDDVSPSMPRHDVGL